jgi:integrase
MHSQALATTGLRVGEILGLQAGDFDFERRVLHIRRSVWRGKLRTTKNVNSEAMLPIPAPLADIVRAHIVNVNPGKNFSSSIRVAASSSQRTLFGTISFQISMR